jgi:hypothetical protein
MLRPVCPESAATLLAAAQHVEADMIDSIEPRGGHDDADRQIGSWQVVVSAWTLVVLFFFLLAAVSAVACTRTAAPPHRLARAVIPQHEPCEEPNLPSAYTVDGCKGVPVTEDRSAYW